MPPKTPSDFWMETVAAILEDHDLSLPADTIASIAVDIEEAATSCTASAPDPGWSEQLAREIHAAEVRGARIERAYEAHLQRYFPGYQRYEGVHQGSCNLDTVKARALRRA